MLAKVFKMVYRLILCTFTIFSLFLNGFLIFCHLLIPLAFITPLVLIVVTKFIKLKDPKPSTLEGLLGQSTTTKDSENTLDFPIANKGGIFDVPENSVAALKQCVAKNCKNVLLDLNITKCNNLVVLSKTTLEKAGIKGNINEMTLDELEKLNIVENHPLSNNFESEKVLTLDNLLKLADEYELRLFLLVTNTSTQMYENLKTALTKHENFTDRVVLCPTSPILVYQLRKQYSNLVCGLWMNKTVVGKDSFLFKTSATLLDIYMAIIRNIVAPAIGIKVVLLNKEEFSAHIDSLWRSVGVQCIVYTVNSPNEKRYFQQVLKTRYLTDSLRSEPQVIFKFKAK